MRRLPDTGLKALWALEGQSATRAELEHALRDKGWAANTYLSRLADKGFVQVRREGKNNLYTPLVTREAYQAFDSRAVLDRLYGTPRNFVAALAKGGLAQQDLDELRSLLDELNGGQDRG